MANGDTALADGMDVLTGEEDRRQGYDEINKSRDYIAGRAKKVHQHLKADITDLPAVAGANSAEANKIPVYNAGGQLTSFPPELGPHVATKAYVDAKPIPTPQLTDGGTFLRAEGKNLGTTGALFAGGSAILSGVGNVISGWRALYIDSNGTVGVTPSAAKYKTVLGDYDGNVLGLRAVIYTVDEDETQTPRLGIVADDANEIEPLLVVHEDGEVESFKYELLAVALLAEVQRLSARVEALEAGGD